MAKKSFVKPVHLTFRSVESVLVEADDEDRFLLTMQEAAHTCKRAQDAKEWDQDFKKFLGHVRLWCEAHQADVQAGYVAVGDGALNIFVRTKSEEYNFDLDDSLSDLDIELVKKFPWLNAEVLQAPGKISEDQLLSDNVVTVYGDGS